MGATSIEQRVAALERTVAQLRKNGSARRRTKDWRRVIGALTDDPGALAILEQAQQLRRRDRADTRPKAAKSARAKR